MLLTSRLVCMTIGVSQALQKLRTYDNSSYPILSVYLPLTSEKKLIDLFYEQIKTLTDLERQEVEQDIEYVAAFLQLQKWQKKYQGLALFSGGNKLWEVVTTSRKLPSKVIMGHSAYLFPLISEEYPQRRYLVIVADRKKATYLTLADGQIEEQGNVFDDSVPQRVTGDTNEAIHDDRSDKINRHMQHHLHKHFELISQRIKEFTHNKHISGVIVGGHKELFHVIEEHLPKYLRSKVVGEFSAELNGSFNELLSQSKEIINRIEQGLKQKSSFQNA